MQNKAPFESSPIPFVENVEPSCPNAPGVPKNIESVASPENRIERIRRKAAFAYLLTAIRPERVPGGSDPQSCRQSAASRQTSEPNRGGTENPQR
ncbi:MAG: hypothetical protein WCH98_20470 [Verrucomicrobiota bacterium]